MKYYKIDADPGMFKDNPLYKMFREMCELPPNAKIPFDQTAADNLTEDSADVKKYFDAAVSAIISLVNRTFNKSFNKLSDLEEILLGSLYKKITDTSAEPVKKLKEIQKSEGVFTKKPPKGSLTDKAAAIALNKRYKRWFNPLGSPDQ